MTAKNDITGDSIASRMPTDAYRDGHDRIFGKKEKPVEPEDTFSNSLARVQNEDNTEIEPK